MTSYHVILLHRYEKEVALYALVGGVFFETELLEAKKGEVVYSCLIQIRHSRPRLISLEARQMWPLFVYISRIS